MSSPSTEWYAGLSVKDKKSLEDLLKTKPMVLRRLKEILTKKLDELNGTEIKMSVYDSPSWPYLQAHFNGEKARLKKTIDLLSFIDPE